MSEDIPPQVVAAAVVGRRSRRNGAVDAVRGFREFIHDYSVLPLAIGVVIGTAVNDLIKTLVEGLITPFIALIVPGQKLQNFQLVFHGSTFKIGIVLNALISFFIVALIVYVVAKFVLKNETLLKK